MKIAMVPHFQKPLAVETAKQVIALAKGHQIFVHSSFAHLFPTARALPDYDQMTRECDFFIAVGGDGTIIHAAKHAAGKPLLGVNVGRLGYMAGLERDELEFLPDILNGVYCTEERMMVDACVNGRCVGSALNEAVVSGAFSKILDFDVQADDAAFHYRADGVIISTPTGSTAYSLSAGGPVVDPLVRCMIFTPICPHTLLNRSVIFSENTCLSVTVKPNYMGKIYLTLDGETPVEIKASDVLRITASEKRVKLILRKKKNFYDVMNKKLLLPAGSGGQ